jgi:hypothetical protein
VPGRCRSFATRGHGDPLLEEDRSVASGRPMADIAAGKGPLPKPFMLQGGSTFRPTRFGVPTGMTDLETGIALRKNRERMDR